MCQSFKCYIWGHFLLRKKPGFPQFAHAHPLHSSVTFGYYFAPVDCFAVAPIPCPGKFTNLPLEGNPSVLCVQRCL